MGLIRTYRKHISYLTCRSFILRRRYFSNPAYVQPYKQQISLFHHGPCCIIPLISLLHCSQFYNGNTQGTLQLFTKVNLVKICWLFCQFCYTYRNSEYFVHQQREKSLRHYVNLIVKVFEGNFEITPDRGILNAS